MVGPASARRSVRIVDYLVDQFDRFTLNSVPVVRPGIDPRIIEIFRDSEVDGRGWCLRLPIRALLGFEDPREEVNRLLDLIQASPRSVDMVVDHQYMPQVLGFGARHVMSAIEELPYLSMWRSVIILGTVIPKTLAKFPEDCITILRRHEWELWHDLQTLGISRVPTLGDYAVQNPERPKKGGGWKELRANIRYSTPQRVLMARGRAVAEYCPGEYRKVAAMLVAHHEFREISWGDRQIRQCADGLCDPGKQEKWRAVGTSHHISVMLDALANLPTPSKAGDGINPSAVTVDLESL